MTDRVLERFFEELERRPGWEVRKARTNHHKLYVDGHYVLTMASSPRSPEISVRATRRLLRRLGLPA